MKREIRNLLIFAAAALSVVAVPLITALVAHLDGTLVAAIVGVVSATVAALATLAFWAYSRGRAYGAAEAKAEALERHLAELTASLEEVRRQRNAVLDPASSEQSAADAPELRVLRELALVESEARAFLGERASASIIRLRLGLQDSGVWSEEDVHDFDAALRIRNKVAHGDQKELTRESLEEAIETMRRLRHKLEASQVSPPHG